MPCFYRCAVCNRKRYINLWSLSPALQWTVVRNMMIVCIWRMREKISRTVLCFIVYNNNCTKLFVVFVRSYDQFLLWPGGLALVSFCV